MINQANRRPGHATYPSAIRSMPFAPYSFVRKSGPKSIALFYHTLRLAARGSSKSSMANGRLKIGVSDLRFGGPSSHGLALRGNVAFSPGTWARAQFFA